MGLLVFGSGPPFLFCGSVVGGSGVICGAPPLFGCGSLSCGSGFPSFSRGSPSFGSCFVLLSTQGGGDRNVIWPFGKSQVMQAYSIRLRFD